MSLITTITPQFSDVDSFQHINHLTVLRWFEAARMPICYWFIPDHNLAQMRLIMARIEADYFAEMFFGSSIEIRTGISKIGKSSFHVTQEAYQDGKPTARGTVVLIHYDHETKQPVPLTLELREKLEQLAK